MSITMTNPNNNDKATITGGSGLNVAAAVTGLEAEGYVLDSSLLSKKAAEAAEAAAKAKPEDAAKLNAEAEHLHELAAERKADEAALL